MKYDLDYYNFTVFPNKEGEEYDEDRSMMGFEGNELYIAGDITFNNKERIGFAIPVALFRVSADLVDEDNTDILILNPKAQKLATKFEFSLRPNTIQFDADISNYGEKCAAVIEEGVNQGVKITASKIIDDLKVAIT